VNAIPRRGAFAALLALAVAGALGAQEGVLGTLHDLSVTGASDLRSLSETQVCKFCHIPHNAVEAQPLWGRTLSKAQYEMPTVPTAQGRAAMPQPDGSSRLCLSCHDGTIALGESAGNRRTAAREGAAGAARFSPGQRGYLGTDLSGGHPISFTVPDGDATGVPDRDMGLRPLTAIAADPDVRLDPRGKLQCTTCHDPHSDRHYVSGRVPHFWVKNSIEGVCLTCHEPR